MYVCWRSSSIDLCGPRNYFLGFQIPRMLIITSILVYVYVIFILVYVYVIYTFVYDQDLDLPNLDTFLRILCEHKDTIRKDVVLFLLDRIRVAFNGWNSSQGLPCIVLSVSFNASYCLQLQLPGTGWFLLLLTQVIPYYHMGALSFEELGLSFSYHCGYGASL